MAECFDVKVPAKEELKKALIFGLTARAPIAIIAGMVGYRQEIIPKM